ncbi:hypothetical protein [Paenibacillus wynnii]|uniref:Uncharacterized protein n=1 Tax=Paenibacillus wynnii TaxID=268407 RepID=A0A098M7U1_9BACL|nr:hypothetical protein [Paenibacillus wynnii]KGE17612.1 hypothetical protein PWYN_23815 [Paenibacillus wynnii]
MNIGSMIRGLLGDSKVTEPKSLELKEGQIVRGVVLSVSESGKEAVVQIQGTPVRAELETPLKVGQTMNLQVSPPGEGGLPVLKAVSMGEAALVSPQSMGEALETLGLSDAKAGREIVQAMQSGGVPLTKETAEMLKAVMNAKPAGVPTEQWLEAAVISVKRGLPVTAESVKGLQQAVFGPQLHQLIANLEEQLNVWVGQKKGGGEGATLTGVPIPSSEAEITNSMPKASSTGETVSQTTTDDGVSDSRTGKIPLNSLEKGIPSSKGTGAVPTGNVDVSQSLDVTDEATNGGRNLSSGVRAGAGEVVVTSGNGFPQAPNGSPVGGALGTLAGNSPASLLQDMDGIPGAEKGNVSSASNLPEGKGAERAGNATIAVKTAGDTGGSSGAVKDPTNGVNTVTAGNGTAVMEGAGNRTAPSAPALLAKLQGVLTELRGTLPQLAAVPPAAAAGQEPAPAASAPRGGDSPAAAAQPLQGAPAPAHDTESWVGRVLKLLGAEHEQQAVRGGAAIAAEARPAAAGIAADGRSASVLPALNASVGEVENADTLKGVLLQVLGSSEVPPALKEAASQLVQHMTGQQLLLNTDRTAPFAQVTLFLPLQGPNGEETASVHIQSRRGRKGELDAANCRLWFDLDMKRLGQTLVDVQVVDRIVSLKLHNNEPWVLELLENRRDEIKAAVESIGYQLSGLKTEPLPVLKGTDSDKNLGKLTDFVPDSYKGVDYRI